MRRTISGMIGAGSLAHNRRDFVAENVDPDRVHLNICYQNENLKEVYKELFNDSVERCNVGKRKDRQITNYYEKIRQGKQEKLFHEVIFQIGNREDMAVGTTEGDLAVKVLDEYVKNFQQRNPTLHVFSCYLLLYILLYRILYNIFSKDTHYPVISVGNALQLLLFLR